MCLLLKLLVQLQFITVRCYTGNLNLYFTVKLTTSLLVEFIGQQTDPVKIKIKHSGIKEQKHHLNVKLSALRQGVNGLMLCCVLGVTAVNEGLTPAGLSGIKVTRLLLSVFILILTDVVVVLIVRSYCCGGITSCTPPSLRLYAPFSCPVNALKLNVFPAASPPRGFKPLSLTLTAFRLRKVS